MKRVFVDTGGFVALLVARDASHEHAVALFERAEAESWTLLTTNFVIVETYSVLLVRARDGRRSAIEFLRAIAESGVEIERVTEDDERAAIDLVHAHEDKEYSLCDALSFVVMERLDVSEAIAFDDHFRAYGRFTIL